MIEKPKLKSKLEPLKDRLHLLDARLENRRVTWLLFQRQDDGWDNPIVNLHLFRNGIKLPKSSYWFAWDRSKGHLVGNSGDLRVLAARSPEVFRWVTSVCLHVFGSVVPVALPDVGLMEQRRTAKVIPMRRRG